MKFHWPWPAVPLTEVFWLPSPIPLNTPGTKLETHRKSAIDRNVGDRRVVEGSAGLRVGGVHDRERFGDGDRLRGCAGLQREGHTNVAADFHLNVLALDGLEAHEFSAHRVDTWNQVGSRILAGRVRDQRSVVTARDVDDRHFGAGDGPTRLIRNLARDTPGVELSAQWNARQQQSDRRGQQQWRFPKI